jgi:predicted glycosyltransferase
MLVIPAVVVDCDEQLVVAIALIEADLEENLTQPETLQAIFKAAKHKPSVIETVFDIDSATITVQMTTRARAWLANMSRFPDLQPPKIPPVQFRRQCCRQGSV